MQEVIDRILDKSINIIFIILISIGILIINCNLILEALDDNIMWLPVLFCNLTFYYLYKYYKLLK
jgi:hypothetical protein